MTKPGQFKDLYPDLKEKGGLKRALHCALEEIGSSLAVAELDKATTTFVAFANVRKEARHSQVFIAAEERLFLVDFWNLGVQLATGRTSNLAEVAHAIDKWIARECNIDELQKFDFVQVSPLAHVYERSEEVEHRWQSYLSCTHERFPELVAFVTEAASRPKLRQLFPYTSLDRFCFSRCTGYPFTTDTPYVAPLGEARYAVLNPSGELIGSGSAKQAVEMVIENLPRHCGPAVPGTAEDLAASLPR
jgi:hypothetical protein